MVNQAAHQRNYMTDNTSDDDNVIHLYQMLKLFWGTNDFKNDKNPDNIKP